MKTERRLFEFHFVLLFEILDVDEVDDADVDAVEDAELNFIFLLRHHRHRLGATSLLRPDCRSQPSQWVPLSSSSSSSELWTSVSQ